MSARIDAATERGIVNDYQSGVRFMEIVRKYGVGSTTVARTLKRNAVMSPSLGKKDVRRSLMSWQERAAIAWYRAGLTAAAIAMRFNCSERTIRATLTRYAVRLRVRGPQYVSISLRAKTAALMRKRWCDPDYRTTHLPQLARVGFQAGSKHRGWRHGKSKWRSRVSGSAAYRKFRELVLSRDGNWCQYCTSSCALDVHHIIPVRAARHLMLEVANAITLCRSCHMKMEAELRRANHK